MPHTPNGHGANGRPVDPTSLDLRAVWTAEVDRVASRRRWGLALLAIGVVHLVAFLGLQTLLWVTGGLPHWPYPVSWIAEFAAVCATMQAICGTGWLREPGMAGVVVRVWGTFFILSFNLAANNEFTGWEIDWFKASWCTLATFGFATMSWLFSLWFLVPAVGFYFLGLFAVHYAGLFYLAHGLSWWLTLTVIGGWLERRRRQRVGAAMLGHDRERFRSPAVAAPGRSMDS